MLRLPPNVRVFVAAAPADMRRQIDGLATLVREGMQRSPESGDLYLFRNRRGDMIKLLFFDPQGYCLLVKRMERGVFAIADVQPDAGTLEVSATELMELLSGLVVRARVAAPSRNFDLKSSAKWRSCKRQS